MMNKFIARILLFFIVFSQLQIGNMYVSAKQDILSIQNNSVQELEQIEQAIDSSVERIDKKLKNRKKKQRLKQKQKEIKQLIKDAKKQLKKEKNKDKLKEIKKNAKNRAVLKITSGVIDYENIKNNLNNDLKNNLKKQKRALKTLNKSLKNKEDFQVIIHSKSSKKELLKKYKNFDKKIKIKKLYKKGKKTYFTLSFSKKSIFQEELFGDIENGELPQNLGDFEVVKPEIFTIDSLNLEGENLSQSWGVEEYDILNHISNIDFDFKTESKKIKVGIIDTGIDYSHPDLKQSVNTTLDKDFVNDDDDAMDDQGHGTHVAGTIGANINQDGIIGINPYVELIPLKICDDRGFCPSYALIEAIDYATEQDIDILNLSLGGRGDTENHPICLGIEEFVESGGIAISAAGNSNILASQFLPGGCEHTVTVGAYDKDQTKAVFSNFGIAVDISAPGVDIYSTYPDSKGSYTQLSGTSMAAPHISGLASVLLAQNNNLIQEDFLSLVKSYPITLLNNGDDKIIGNGIDVQFLMSDLQSGVENIDENSDNQPENIAEYIENYVEEEDLEEYETPESILFPLDDLTIEDINFEINQNDEIFEPEVFSLNPIINFNQIEINSVENKEQHLNEDTQSFSIIDENVEQYEEIVAEDMNTSEYERISIPEVIGEGPNYDSKNIEFQNPFKDISDIEINNFEENIIHEEIIEGETKTLEIIPEDKTPSEIVEDGVIEHISSDGLLLTPGDEHDENTAGIDYKIETLKSEQIYTENYNFSDIIIPSDEETETGLIFSDGEINFIDNLPEQEHSLGVQNIQSCEFEILKGKCSFNVGDSWNYQFHDTHPGVVRYTRSSDNLYFFGVGTGTTTISLLQDDIVAYTFNVTVTDIAGGEEYFTYSEGTEPWVIVYYSDQYNILLSSGLRKSRTASSGIKISPMKPGNHSVTILEKATGKIIKTLHYEVVPHPPVIHEKILYVGDNHNALYDRFYFKTKTFSASVDGIVSLNRSYKWLYINAHKAGYVEAYIKEGDIMRDIIKVTVKDIPIPVDLNCTVRAGESCSFDLPVSNEKSIGNSSSSYINSPVLLDGGMKVQVQTQTGRYYRNTNFQVLGERGFPIANITINITPDSPKYDCHMVKGGYCTISLRYAEGYDSVIDTNGIFNYSARDDTITISGIEVGEGRVEIKDSNHYYLADISVYVYNPELVNLQEVECEIWGINQNCEIDFLSSNIFQYTVSNTGIIRTSTSHDKITLQSLKLGSTKVYVKFGNITIGTINVTVGTQANKYKCELNIDKECNIYLGKYISRMSFESDTPGIVELTKGGNRGRNLYVKALKPGRVNVYIWNSRYRKYEAQVEIIVTQPTKTSCTILEGETCILEGLPKYFNYEVLKDGVRVGRSNRDARNYGDPMYLNLGGYKNPDGSIIKSLEGLRSGKVEFHIYKFDYSNKYLLHIIEVEIIESPIETVSMCETRVNGSCQITLRNIGTDKYTIQVSEGGYTEMILKRDYLYMKGVKEGNFQVLIKNNETNEIVHRGEVKIEGFYKISVPRPKTELSTTDVILKVGEAQTVNMIEGNSFNNYRIISTYPNITVKKSGTSGLEITAENSDQRSGIIYLIDQEKEYENAKIYVTIDEGNNDGGDNEGGDTPGDDDQTLGFHDFVYEALTDIEIGFVHFKVTGNPTQVGIQYITQDDTVAQEILTANDNGLYSLIIDKEATPDSATAYSNFMPFYTDENNDIYYYANDNYLSFSSIDGKGRVLDYVGIESIENIGVQESNNSLIFNGAIQTKIDRIIARIIAETQIHGQIPAIISRVKEVKNKPNISVGGLDLLNYLESGLKGIISNVEVTSYEYTENVEDGYIGGLYFQVNDPNLIQEVGIEYYNNVNYSNSNIIWEKEVLENEGDGEFASFILPKTKFTNVRGYVIDNNGGRIYTNIGGDIITAGTPLLNYYNTDSQVIASEDNIEVSALPLVPIAIFIGSFAISAYSSYQCEQEEGWINLSCGVAVGTTVVSLASLGQGAVKLAATKFATKKSSDDIIIQGVTNWPKPIPGGTYINGTWFSEHALARMMPVWMQHVDSFGVITNGRGITPTVVFNAIQTGVKSLGNKPNTLKFVSDDGITVIVSDNLKRIITAY